MLASLNRVGLRRAMFVAAAVSAAFLAAPAAALADPAPASIAGRWRSVAPEAQGPIFATRDFRIDAKRWRVRYRAFADAQGATPLFEIDVAGFYRLGGVSPVGADVREGIFPALERRLTALSPQGVAMFAGMGCTLTVGVARDLVETGCGFVPSLMSVMGEYDLAAIRDGALYFGDRSGDLAKARPSALTPYPLRRR